MLALHCCAWAFSSCGEWELLFVVVLGVLTAVASLFVEHRLKACGLQWLWPKYLVAPRHVESSQIRNQTCVVPCMSNWIPIYCTTRKVPAP